MKKHVWKILAMALMMALLLPTVNLGSTATAAGPDGGKQAVKITSKTDSVAFKVQPQLREAASAAASDAEIQVVLHVRAGTDVSRYMTWSLTRPFVGPSGEQAVIGGVRAGNLAKLSSVDGVSTIRLAENPFAPPKPIEARQPVSAEKIQQRLASVRANYSAVEGVPDRSGNVSITGWFDVLDNHKSAAAWANGFTGAGVKAMVNDSGVDFCHPDLQGTWAVISDTASPYNGWPEMFDSRSVYFWALDSYTGDTTVARGLADYADTSATCTSGADCLYQPIGATEAHTYTLPATSQSGTYHIGSHPDKALQNWWYGERVAILVVDENTAGVYDTVYVDLNDNYDFTDDPTATKASPTACADMDGDGYADVSGGLVYFIADGVNPIPTSDWMWGLGVAGNNAQDFGEPDNGSLVAFSLNDTTFTDHGQLVASNIVAQGVIDGGAPSYKPAGDGTPGTGLVLGAGKDVGLTSNGDFYQSFFVEDGFIFSALGYDGVPGTDDDIQAINNSWGTSSTDNDGWDEESRLIDNYQSLNPNLSVLVATGNGAPGFGTVTSPNPPSGIGVGASTEMGSTGWDSATTADQITHGDMAPWSDRGPGARGDAGVHVVADGSYASGDLALNEIGDGWNAWETWGGTSRACPVAVGNLALVYDAYKQTNGVWPDFRLARAILMSGADNINYDVLIQGAGRVNADRATQIAAGMGPGLVRPESWQVGDYRGMEYPAFANIIHPGQSDTQTFSVSQVGALGAQATSDVTFNVQSDILRKVSEQTFDWTTADLSQEDAYSFNRPGYLRNLTPDIPAGTDLMVVRVIYPYSEWDIDGDYVQDQYWRVVLYDWTDVSGDGALWTDTNGNGTVNGAELEDGEYVRFAYLHSYSNNRAVYVQNPLGRMHDGVFLGLQHAGTDARVPVSHLKVRVEYYQHQAWDWLTTSTSSVTVPAGGEATFDATVNVPASAGYGVYDGAIMVSPATVSAASGPASMEGTIVVPVIVNVAAFSTDFSFGGASSGDTLYDNAQVFGTQDWRWRAESGDWRFFFTDVPDSTPAGTNFLVKTDWQNGPHTDIDTIIMGPTQDCYSNGVGCKGAGAPAYYGPYTLGVVGKSPNTNIHDGTWTFDTSTGGPQDLVSAPAKPGLNLIALHNVNFEGSDFSENFVGQVGTITANPNTINIVTASDSGSFDIQVSSSMGLPDYNTDGFGLGVPQVYTNQPISQDDPNDPTTASYTKTVTLNHAGLLDITTGNTSGSDIDLFLYYDSNGDGTFDESMGSSTTSGDEEQITLQFPADGDYMIAVHGWSVAGGADTFDLTVDAIQGTDITAAAAPSGPFGPNTSVMLHYTYNAAAVAPGNTASGLITLGPSTAPGALEIPVTISRVGSLNFSFQQGDDNGYSGTTDTWINAWATGASYGSTSGLQVRQNNVMSGLIRFDTSSLPAGWTVTSAKLKVYSHYASGLPTQITAYKMSKAWDPTTATWLAANASTNWTGPGATGTDDRASTAVASFTADAPGWYTIDVTSAVQDWINDPASNFGLILVGSGDVSSRHDFRSSDWMVQSERPILEVNFGS